MDLVPKSPAFLDKQAHLSIEDANETHIGDYVKTVCAVLNSFHPARHNNIEDDNVIAQRTLDLMKKPNYLQPTFEENGWGRKRVIWTLLSDFDLPDFSRLTWKEQRYLTSGIYQLKQSRSNTHEHLNQSGM
ncbi:DDE Tnp4 domain-containing protein [Trichonephila clavipes]|nr:DDE Tnp4 domain-containing protein [Trichonephila clavipes]